MTLPSPRLHPDPATDPAPDDGRGDWALYGWVPVVFAVYGGAVAIQNVRVLVRWVRYRLCGVLYAAADALNDAPPLDPERQDVVGQRIMGEIEADAVRGRGGAT